MHIDIAELEAFQAEYLPGNVLILHDILNVRNDNFKSFDTYLKNQINIIQRQIEDLNQ
ncbi:hypothetical protein [Lysinibacillus capsici]|uniref:hypothetical protein n=1 Tax=Lysinibacillus capsici TaxID=2115968 RepID=UPI00325F9E0E